MAYLSVVDFGLNSNSFILHWYDVVSNPCLYIIFDLNSVLTTRTKNNVYKINIDINIIEYSFKYNKLL